MDKEQFKIEITKLFGHIDDNFFSKIEIYKKFLTEENKKMNLTRLDNDKIYSHYFYESIVPYKDVNFTNIKNLLDIGSGSGIPGVILKLLFSNIHVDLMESSTKKVNFLSQLISKLNLSNIDVLNQRAEEIKEYQREKYDLVTSRAVSNLKILLEISTPYAKVNGLIVEPKSQKADSEFNLAQQIIKKINLKLVDENKFSSVNNFYHCVFIFKKIAKTANCFPRSWKQIIK